MALGGQGTTDHARDAFCTSRDSAAFHYADALMRRAGIATSRATRDDHLKALIERYLENGGTSKFSAEQVSRVAYNAGPLALGDYFVSTHKPGELIGTVLDFNIRDATNGARSMDDGPRDGSRRK
jgi:predicted metalloprotease with PDZ domain